MITFTIQGSALLKLARLALATETDGPGPLRNIAMRVTATAVRFSATNGKLLASVILDIIDLQGDVGDLAESILDCAQFTAACKTVGKHCHKPVTISIDKAEARVTFGTVSSLVRRHEGVFPSIDHIWTRTSGLHWVPCTSSLDPALTSIAQKIAGNTRMLFRSPVHPSTGLQRLWTAASEDETTPALSDLRNLVRAPAYWADHELAILLMPITRGDAEDQLDLVRFACPLIDSQVAAAA